MECELSYKLFIIIGFYIMKVMIIIKKKMKLKNLF